MKVIVCSCYFSMLLLWLRSSSHCTSFQFVVHRTDGPDTTDWPLAIDYPAPEITFSHQVAILTLRGSDETCHIHISNHLKTDRQGVK